MRPKVIAAPAALCLILATAPSWADSRLSTDEPARMSQQPPEQLRATADSVDQLRREIDKMNRGPKTTAAGIQKQISLTLQQAKVLIGLGQALSIAPIGAKRPQGKGKSVPVAGKNEERAAFEQSHALLSELLAHPAAGPALSTQQRGIVMRLRGTASYYLNDYAAALKDFEVSLKADPSSAEAGWTAFMAAEEHFELSSFARAAEYYRMAQSRSPSGSRTWELARYKLAWCMVNMDKMQDAERAFLDIVRSSQDEALGQDAARDVAFMVARTKNELQLLSMYDQSLAKTAKRGMAFLKKGLATLEAQGRLGSKSLLRDRVLQLETDPELRVAILMDSVQGVAREFASQAHADRILEVLAQSKGLPEEALVPLENASERVCRIFADTYAGKAKTPEKLDRPQMARMVQRLISEHLKSFPKSPRRAKLQEAWLEVCELENDSNCLLLVSGRMLSENEQPSAVRTRALDARLLGLDRLHSGANGQSYRKPFKQALADRLADPSARNAPVAGARLAQLQVEEKDFSGAVATLTAVMKRQPTQEYWYSLKWAQLQAGDLKAVMEGPEKLGLKPLAGAPDPRLRPVLAEASLKLATGAKTSGEMGEMGARLKEFEKLTDDPGKVNLARDEWVATLLDKKLHPEVIKRFAELPPAWHQRSEAGAFKSRLLTQLMEEGQIQLIGSWMLNWPEQQRRGPDQNLALLGLLYWGGVKSIGADRVRSLEETQRNVWLSAVVLSHPEWADRYFKKFAPSTAAERAMDKLAQSLLGRVAVAAPTQAVSLPTSEFEKSAARVVFSSSSNVKAVQQAIEKVKQQRVHLVSALKGQVAEVQVKMLAAQRRLESGAAEMILGSPIPGGLKPDQLAQYQAGLKQLASDHENQVQELDQARARIEQKVQELKQARDAEESAKILPMPADPESIAPSGQLRSDAPARNAVKMIRSANPWGALMELERLRANKLVDGEDYWRLRSWAIISRRAEGSAEIQKPVLLRYVYDELSEAGMQGVIDAWRKK